MMRCSRFWALVLAPVLLVAACGRDAAAPGTTATPASTTSAPTTLPPTTIRPTTVPATTVPATTVPATTVPATTLPPTTLPATTLPAASTPGTTAAATIEVRSYFAHGELLAVVHRTVPATVAVLRTALEQLLAGPTARERTLGLATAVPKGTRLLGVDLDSGIATIDLSTAFDDGGGTLSMRMRLGQVVFTATQYANVRAVRFRMGGTPVTALGGEGIVVATPQTRAMYEDVSGAVVIEEPGFGDVVRTPLRVSGTSNAFEAMFTLEVRSGEAIVATTPVQATSGSGSWGTFSTSVTFPGHGSMTLEAYDPGGCGNDPECPVPVRTIYAMTAA